MALEIMYRIKDTRMKALGEIGCFDHAIFTEGSLKFLTLPEAVAFHRERGAILQSAREAAAFRVAIGTGLDKANEYEMKVQQSPIKWRGTVPTEDNANFQQLTRTTTAYFRDGSAWYAAIDDIADPEQNIVLSSAYDGYETLHGQNRWTLPKSDQRVKSMLERAIQADRVFAVSRDWRKLPLWWDGAKSAFGLIPGINAILGEISDKYAALLEGGSDLAHKGYVSGALETLMPERLESFKLGEDMVEIRAVSLNTIIFHPVVDAEDGRSGCSRGVHYERPPINQVRPWLIPKGEYKLRRTDFER